MMNTSSALLLFVLFSICLTQVPELFSKNPETNLDFMGICKFHDFLVEEHFVTTQDGYILRMFRVQAQGQKLFQDKEHVVFWQHGLLDSADGGICNDVTRAPIFMFATRGYDVWVGNSRGNRYSSNHTTLNPKKGPLFWDFSFQHMGVYDIPAELSYVAAYTGKKIHYVGHSQGTTQMFATLSLNTPGVREHMHEFIALAPVTYLQHQTTLSELADSKLFDVIDALKINEIFGQNWYSKPWAGAFCSVAKLLCKDLIAGLMDWDTSIDNTDRADVIASHLPTSTSTTNLFHWTQLVKSKGKFVQLDYRSDKLNMEHYGTVTPPLFPLQNIDPSLKIYFFVGYVDKLADAEDANILARELSQVVETLVVKSYYMGHATFLLGSDMKYINDVYAIIESKN